MKKIKYTALLIALFSLSVTSLHAAGGNAKAEEPASALVNPPIPPPPPPSGPNWGIPPGTSPAPILPLYVVIMASELIIFEEIEYHNTGVAIIPNPTNPELPPGYVGNTYDPALYSYIPYLDYYWDYSPLNPTNW